jgi:hypothetical protein
LTPVCHEPGPGKKVIRYEEKFSSARLFPIKDPGMKKHTKVASSSFFFVHLVIGCSLFIPDPVEIKHNVVGWLEIPATDRVHAVLFYTAVFKIGFTLQHMEPQDMALMLNSENNHIALHSH